MNIPYPKITSISAREKKLIEDYCCVLPDESILVAHKGVTYDGASIPKAFWSVIGSPFTGRYQRAAFLHDMMYAAELYSRKKCDEIFLDIMKLHGCSWLKRNIIWCAVAAFGRSVWNKHEKTHVLQMKKKIYIRK